MTEKRARHPVSPPAPRARGRRARRRRRAGGLPPVRAAAKLEFLAFGQAVAGGAAVTEARRRRSTTSSPINPTPLPVLLYEGQELLGAKQNRTIDVSVLVGRASASTCRSAASSRAAGTRPRRRGVRARAPLAPPAAARHEAACGGGAGRRRAPGACRPGRGVARSGCRFPARRMTAHASTGALHDVFEQRGDALARAEGHIALHDRQTGMIAAIGGRLVVLDAVGPDVFAALHGPLVRGYALDASPRRRSARRPSRPRAPWSRLCWPRPRASATPSAWGSICACARPPSPPRPWSPTARSWRSPRSRRTPGRPCAGPRGGGAERVLARPA